MGLVQAVHQYKHDHHGQLITWVSKKRRYKDAVGVTICLASLFEQFNFCCGPLIVTGDNTIFRVLK